MPSRSFTPEEANRALAEVRPVAERMVGHREAVRELLERRAHLTAGNGGGSEAGQVQAELSTRAAAIARCVEELEELGVLVKDLDRGLVDFPARRGSEEVLLCWHVGEERVGYWHGVDEGFAGRKPLPL